MDWISIALSLADNALELLVEKEKNKYKDKKIKLETEYYEEKKKARPNHARLDDLEHQLFVLCDAIGSAATGQKAPA